MRHKQCKTCRLWYIESKGWCSYHKVKHVFSDGEVAYLCPNIEDIPKCGSANNHRGGVDNRKTKLARSNK